MKLREMSPEARAAEVLLRERSLADYITNRCNYDDHPFERVVIKTAYGDVELPHHEAWIADGVLHISVDNSAIPPGTI